MDLVSEIKKIPPVTRFLCLATVGLTGAAKIGMLNPYWIFFHTKLVLNKFQFWRIYSSLLLGKTNLSFIFELIMLYRTMNDVESRSYERRSSDLAYQLLWVAPAIIGATLPLDAFFGHKALLLAITYLYSRLAPTGGMTSIMGFFQLPVKYQPYIMIAFDLFTGGKEEVMLDVAGCVVGHIWWWTVWGGDSSGNGTLSSYAKSPEWLRRLMGEHGPRVVGGARSMGGGVYVNPPRSSAAPTTSGYNWGSGRRLGN